MRGANILFNLVTFVFVVLTLGVLLYIFAIAGGRLDPPLLAPPTDVPTPTLIPDTGEVLPTPFLPTFTPSHTPEPSASPELSPTPTLTTTPPPALAPTNLPLAPVDPALPEPTLPPPEGGGDGEPDGTEPDAVGSAALAALPGFRPSFTPSITLRAPATARATATATITLTPGPRPTSTVTATPQGPPPPTLSPYAFVAQPGTPLLRESFAEGTAGCAWQGLGGTVIDQRGEAVVGVEVHVRGSASGEQIVLAGTDTDYGPSGWEVRLGGGPARERVTVMLVSEGQALSPAVEVTFPAACAQNLALINFVQTRTF